jgi:hypothetical protein
VTVSSKLSPRQLLAVCSVPCDMCRARPEQACRVVWRDGTITRRKMVNAHPGRVALARFLDKIR